MLNSAIDVTSLLSLTIRHILVLGGFYLINESLIKFAEFEDEDESKYRTSEQDKA